VIVVRAFVRDNQPGAALWLSSALVLAGILFLTSIVRRLGGNIAGAIGLVALPLHPELSAFSFSNALSLCCLSALLFVATNTDLRRRRRGAFCLALTILILLVLFSRSHSTGLHPGDNYLLSAGRILCRQLGAAPGHFDPLLALESGVTLWWLFLSIQSRNVVPFALTATPLAYLLCGALALMSEPSYSHSVHPILLANLIAFLGLWWRGRANKRVLDSTTN
jgi:hypothetical protein